MTADINSQSLVEKFIYGCSHDLRAPVSSIQGLVRIAGYYPLTGEVNECLEMIEACAYKMDKLITSLQQFLTDNQQLVKLEILDPNDLVQQVTHEFRHQLSACHIELSSEVDCPEPLLLDRYCIISILKHLVANSVSFLDPLQSKRSIAIRIKSNDSVIRIEVQDNGIGIGEEQQERIFDVFFRGTELSIGSGMGLFLTKGLVVKMGGSISLKSDLQGTTIQLVFPGKPKSNS